MSNSPYKPVVEQLADTVVDHVARRVIASLRRDTTGRQSGDDSGLKNVWEEFCVQVKGVESVFWDVYIETIQQAIRGYVDGMKPHEVAAVWLCSDAGWDWVYDHADASVPPPVLADDVVDSIYKKIHALADEYSNTRIRDYLDSQYSD